MRTPKTSGALLEALQARPQSRAGSGRGVDFPWVDYLRGRTVATDTGCWEWQGATVTGYGWASYIGRGWLVHRLMWTLTRGEIPAGLTIDHLCRNTRCVNPEHLEPVTQGVNNHRSPTHSERFGRTHCPMGHEYTPENTYVSKRNQRQCRACRSRWPLSRKAVA